MLMLVAAYAALSHWLMLSAPDRPWAVAVLFGPLLALMLGVGLARRHGPSIACGLVLVAVLVAVVRSGGVDDINRLYVLQYLGIYLALAWSFGITLRRGSTALITRFATHVHGSLPPAMVQYTSRLTAWWVAFFVGMGTVAVVLYLWTPWSWWSLFANVLTPIALLIMFVGEHLLRYRLHPEFERATLMQAVQAYRHVSGQGGGKLPPQEQV
jgi:uncharacterized membrane protein